MPRTALTTVSTATFSEGVADVGFEAADQSNGNSFTNTGSELLIVNNGSGGNVTITVTAFANRATFNEAWTKTLLVATTDVGLIGPFPTDKFNQADETVYVDWDTDTSITVAVLRPTPPE